MMVNIEQDRKVKSLKIAIKELHEAQDDLRLARARYNKAVSDLVENDSP
jgi:hypothetical protein